MGGGAAITAALQSSSATTGANVGSTGLGWLLALARGSGAPPCPAMSPA
ncbi:MAG: hypothetical protein NTW83_15345 [Cyanobacteria bacterium]|nr:hypothetical protein [Cyanobacteriota bacterium]